MKSNDLAIEWEGDEFGTVLIPDPSGVGYVGKWRWVWKEHVCPNEDCGCFADTRSDGVEK